MPNKQAELYFGEEAGAFKPLTDFASNIDAAPDASANLQARLDAAQAFGRDATPEQHDYLAWLSAGDSFVDELGPLLPEDYKRGKA